MNQNRLPGVREKQCRLLVSTSRNEETAAAAAEEQIRGLVGGKVSHRYAALSLSFKIAVEEKRKGPSVATTPPVQPSIIDICKKAYR